jgi:hypothetical protein
MLKSKYAAVALSLILISTLFASSFSGCSDSSKGKEVYQGMYSYDDFESPATCGSCHTQIYSDWSKSLMAVNYIKQWKQVEYFELAYAQSQQVDEVAGVAAGCIQCHGPLAFLSGEIPPPAASEGGRVNEGVSCEICHSLTGSSEEHPFNFSAVMNLGDTKYGPRADSESPFHETEYSEFIGSPQHCALCHDEQSPYGAWVKETYREWAAGPFPNMDITCIHCHMDTTTGKAALDGKQRDDLTVHTFMAVHSPERRADNIEIIASADSEEARAGDILNISTDIRCLMMGHYFPSGSTEERMLWLEVWATDSAGKSYFIPVNAKGFEGEEYTIANSSAIAYSDMGTVMGTMGFTGVSRDGNLPDGSRIFRRPFFNPDGEMTIMQWYTEENTLVDYRFGPRETKTETFTWKLPANIAAGPITIEFKMYYSLVPSSVGEFLGLEEYYYTAYPAGSSSLIINESHPTPPDTSSKTFGEMSPKGYSIYRTCEFCHTFGPASLADYRNAQSLLQKINGMPGGMGQSGWEVLSYFLVEFGWVSADAVFDPDALAEIMLTD